VNFFINHIFYIFGAPLVSSLNICLTSFRQERQKHNLLSFYKEAYLALYIPNFQILEPYLPRDNGNIYRCGLSKQYRPEVMRIISSNFIKIGS